MGSNTGYLTKSFLLCQKQNNPFLAAESSGWGWGFGGGGGTEEFVESFVPADNKTYEGPEFQEDAQIKVEYVANEHDIYDMKQIKGQKISDEIVVSSILPKNQQR